MEDQVSIIDRYSKVKSQLKDIQQHLNIIAKEYFYLKYPFCKEGNIIAYKNAERSSTLEFALVQSINVEPVFQESEIGDNIIERQFHFRPTITPILTAGLSKKKFLFPFYQNGKNVIIVCTEDKFPMLSKGHKIAPKLNLYNIFRLYNALRRDMENSIVGMEGIEPT